MIPVKEEPQKERSQKSTVSWESLQKETRGHFIHVKNFTGLLTRSENLTLSAWSNGSEIIKDEHPLCAVTLNNTTFVFFHDPADGRLMGKNVFVTRTKLSNNFAPCLVSVAVEEVGKNYPMFSFRAQNTKEVLLGFGTELGDFDDVYSYPVTVFHMDPKALDRSLKKDLLISPRKKSVL